jgi:hypothetical protein
MKETQHQLSGRAVSSWAVFILLAAAAIAFSLHRGQTAATPAALVVTPAKTAASEFSFAGAAGWRTGPTNKTSLAAFSNDSVCFTSMEYKPGTVNEAAELQKQQDDLTAGGDQTAALATAVSTVQTTGGTQQYILHQYRITGNGKQLMGGLALGYMQISGGYITVQAHCNTAEQLPKVVAALQAYRFAPPE